MTAFSLKKSWIAGGVIAVLLGLNIIQGSVLLSLYARTHIAHEETTPVSLSDNHIAQLAPASQAVVRVSLTQAKPVLRARLKAVRKARHELVRYMASTHYNRHEAERRFADLRVKSDLAQSVAQAMLLDAADKLPPEDRAQVVDTIAIEDTDP